MAEAQVLGGAKRSVELNADAFGARFNGPLVHESVRAEFAARRRGSASTKTRGLVSGGGAKPWRQKGTGRARAGSSRSPIWTGGGTVFGPHPRSYTFKVNRKERRAALRSALSLHADRGTLAVLDAASFLEPSTRVAAGLLDSWAQPRATLVVVTAEERSAALSFRNIDRVSVLEPNSVGIADIVGAASLLCSDAALAELTDRATSGGAVGAAGDAADAAPASPAERPIAARSRAASVPATPAAATGAASSSPAEPVPAGRSRAGSAQTAKAQTPTVKADAPAKPKGTAGAAAGAASSSSAQKAPAPRSRAAAKPAAAKPASRSRAAAKPAAASKASKTLAATSKASAKPAAAAKPKVAKPKTAPRGNTTAAKRAPAKAPKPGSGGAEGTTTED
jgi:large subunit ribosomal protein L4